MDIRLNWDDFKTRLDTIFYFDLQYIEYDNAYQIYIHDSINQYICFVDKTTPANSNQTDFETNFKSRSNIFSILSKAINYNPTTIGDQTTPIIDAVTGRKIRILSFAVTIGIEGPNVYMRDGVAGSQISETMMSTITGGTMPVNYNRSAYYPIFLFETSAGNALILNCSAIGTVSVQVVYVLI